MIVFDGFTAQAGSPTIPDKSIIASQPKADSNIFFESEADPSIIFSLWLFLISSRDLFPNLKLS